MLFTKYSPFVCRAHQHRNAAIEPNEKYEWNASVELRLNNEK